MREADLSTPCYIVYEDRIRRNLDLIGGVAQRSGAEIIMAFKANALWRTFGLLRERGVGFTASSLNELRLGNEELGVKGHSYCPAYTDATIGAFIAGSSHITFNTVAQHTRYAGQALAAGVSPGLRVNPECSVIATDIYNPALPGSRFGVTAADLDAAGLPAGCEGFHLHALCESDAADLQAVMEAFESQFGHHLERLRWVNFGGGHLMTRAGYDTQLLVDLIQGFRSRHHGLQVYLEPGSAFMWQTGDLAVSVVDVVSNHGITTAIIDASFACHMPDTLEMPYQPAIEGAANEPSEGYPFELRLGGNSCLSGDYAGPWWFRQPVKPGDRLVLKDMNHYTTVKTTMFNGLQHPGIAWCDSHGSCSWLRQYDYDDYKSRMC